MAFRFVGFELDRERGELRGPDGEAIKLRRKTFDMTMSTPAVRADRIGGARGILGASHVGLWVADIGKGETRGAHHGERPSAVLISTSRSPGTRTDLGANRPPTATPPGSGV